MTAMPTLFARIARLSHRAPRYSSAIVYQGPSMIDGSPIICVITGIRSRSHNSKTGGMVQSYILRADMHPNDACHNGADYAICGNCKHRGVNGKKRTCYVRMDAPASVYRAFQRGSYHSLSSAFVAELVKGRAFRVGTYGDPTAVPASVFAPIVAAAGKVTGYTHRHPVTPMGAYPYLMASVETRGETVLAQIRGLRAFRVIGSLDERAKGEVICPASAEKGHSTTCDKCALCDARKRGPNVAIVVHGAGAGHWKAA